jgi:hypothetical protein
LPGQRTAKRARVEEPSAELYPFPRKPSDEAFERMFEHPIFIKNYKMTGVNAASLVRQKKVRRCCCRVIYADLVYF